MSYFSRIKRVEFSENSDIEGFPYRATVKESNFINTAADITESITQEIDNAIIIRILVISYVMDNFGKDEGVRWKLDKNTAEYVDVYFANKEDFMLFKLAFA